MTRSSLTHEELARVLASLRLGVGASDLHGSLTGYLCAGGSAGAGEWPRALELDPGDEAPLRHEALGRLYRDCRAQLDDPDLGFEPLLPADDAPVARRGDALVEWCRGFLGGVGLSGSPAGLLSADANEVLADFGRIAASRFDYDDDEEDETALGEVLEFVRVGVLLLHTELMRPRQAARHSVH
ncbi:MAG TPA: UPF0149 family protein [Rhodanobacteraceae bacterium]|nr:UPF0149 family protein [Rhodanobacteraceae bacterium]